MALEFICFNQIVKGKQIILPRNANLYKMDFSNNKIDFYYGNPLIKLVKLNTWNIIQNAREMGFDIRSDRIGGYIIISKFYDTNGNLLKIGNR